MKPPANAPSSSAILLDVVRKLRAYVASSDSLHFLASQLASINDRDVQSVSEILRASIKSMNSEVAKSLKAIEASRAYRDMLREYRVPTDQPEEGDND